jgi:hypothetical protein
LGSNGGELNSDPFTPGNESQFSQSQKINIDPGAALLSGEDSVDRHFYNLERQKQLDKMLLDKR